MYIFGPARVFRPEIAQFHADDLLRYIPQVEDPEIFSAEERCFKELSSSALFITDPEILTKTNADHRCLRADQLRFSVEYIWNSSDIYTCRWEYPNKTM